MGDAGDARVATGLRVIGSGDDLTDHVTVFVTTVGAPTLAACLAHLEAQDVRVRFELVDHVAPLPQALQQMLDRCETPYYVQVDEDMLLDSDAVRRQFALMQAEWPNVSILVSQLYDPHLDRAIEGLKLHRLDFGRQFPWNEYPTVSVRNEALSAAGYRVTRRPTAESGAKMTFGIHDIGRDPLTVFERYRDLERARMARPEAIEWFADYPAEFLRRYLEKRDAVDFFALMGVIAAHAADDASAVPATKDFRRRPSAAFEAARALLASGGLPAVAG